MEWFELLTWWLWRPVERLADKYPVLVGVPLMLLPVFILAGMVYLLKILY